MSGYVNENDKIEEWWNTELGKALFKLIKWIARTDLCPPNIPRCCNDCQSCWFDWAQNHDTTDKHGEEILKHDMVKDDDSGELVEVVDIQDGEIQILVNEKKESRHPKKLNVYHGYRVRSEEADKKATMELIESTHRIFV
jgi:uncharacterized protein YbdZ (MbtH family)